MPARHNATGSKAPLLDDQTIKRRMPPCAPVDQPDQRPPARRLLRILVPDRHRLPRADIDVVEVIAARRIEFPELRQRLRSEEHTSELQSLMRISYAVFCLKKKNNKTKTMLQTQQAYTKVSE